MWYPPPAGDKAHVGPAPGPRVGAEGAGGQLSWTAETPRQEDTEEMTHSPAAATRTTPVNEPSRGFTVPGKGPYYVLFLVTSAFIITN